jgi:hypothetical protein
LRVGGFVGCWGFELQDWVDVMSEHRDVEKPAIEALQAMVPRF